MIVMMFAASPDELSALLASQNLAPQAHGLPTVDLGGISPLALVSLDAAVTGADPVEITQVVLGEPLAVIDDGEQLLWAARPALADALASLTSDAPGEAGRAWAESEEMALDGAEPEDCAATLVQLAVLSQHAAAAGASLFTWLCV